MAESFWLKAVEQNHGPAFRALEAQEQKLQQPFTQKELAAAYSASFAADFIAWKRLRSAEDR